MKCIPIFIGLEAAGELAPERLLAESVTLMLAFLAHCDNETSKICSQVPITHEAVRILSKKQSFPRTESRKEME